MVYRGRSANTFRGGGGRGRGRGGRGRGGGGGGRAGFFRQAAGLGNDNHSFSLADEAKNTERHHGNYAGGSLRHVKISFVAAGHLEPSDLLKPINANVPPTEEGQIQPQNLIRPQVESASSSTSTDEEQDQEMKDDGDLSNSPAAVSEGELQQDLDMDKLDLNTPSEAPPPFVVDVVGDPKLRPKGKSKFSMPIYSPARAKSPEPDSAESSGNERIVFIPRKNRPGASRTTSMVTEPGPAPKKPTPPPRKEPTPPPPKVESVSEVEVKAVETVASHTTVTTVTDTIPSIPTLEDEPFKRSTKGNKRRRRRPRRNKDDEEAAIIADYIENVAATMRAEAAEDGDAPLPVVSMRALGGENDPEDAWSSATDSEDAAEDSDAVRQYKNSIWEEHELEDLDALSTDSEDPKGPVETVIGKRKRPSGVQYLIQWVGSDIDSASWVLAQALDSAADDKIAAYEKILLQKATDAAAAALSSSDEDDEDGEDGEDGEDSSEDGEDGRYEDDEKLARFLQRQEEMGITESDMELNMELDELMEMSFPGGAAPKKKNAKGKGKSRYPDIVIDRRTGKFPSATKFADAYDNFDLMDWERPSLAVGGGRKKKGKQPIVLGLSDSEMEENIRNAWDRDREKKKARRAEREALRAEGLLGKNKGVRDPKAKWKEGMSMSNLKEEIRQFLLSELSSISLPPMTKADRKQIHTLAANFGLKSKSTGKGKGRYTTLYKTSTSARYAQDEDTINAVFARKKFFGRPDVGGSSGGRGGRGRGGGGGAGKIGQHREGDIVGGSAPEIAQDNKGRMMLEKMGYRTGMALGTDGNKGIVVPVAAVVKVSRAGLG